MAAFGRVGKEKTNDRANALLKLKADDDELMRNLRILATERDKLADEIVSIKNEGDTLKELLSCSSRDDVQPVYEEFFAAERNKSKFEMSPDENTRLAQRISYIRNYKAQSHLGASIKAIEKKFILVKFLPLPKYTPPELCLLKLEKKKGNKFKVIHFCGPNVVPLEKLKQRYLTEESVNMPSFINAIHQCLWCYWLRDSQVINIKKEIYMKNSIVYHNRGRTVISFTMKFMNKFVIEFSLRYVITSHLPCSFQYAEMDNKIIPNELKSGFEEMKKSFLDHPVHLVLRVNFGNESGEGSINSGEAPSSTTIELFK